MTTEQLRAARAATERCFSFLVADYQYRRIRSRFQWNGFELAYSGPSIGVLVDWYPRDPLTVWLVRLVDGSFPPRDQSLTDDEPLHYFDLGDVEILRSGSRGRDERELYNMPTQEMACRMAASLREYGSDLLRGDLTLIPLLEQRIKDRARMAAVARSRHDGTQPTDLPEQRILCGDRVRREALCPVCHSCA